VKYDVRPYNHQREKKKEKIWRFCFREEKRGMRNDKICWNND